MSAVTSPATPRLEADPRTAAELLPLSYEELRRLPACKLAHEASGQTLQPTALVHEVWLRLTGPGHPRFDQRSVPSQTKREASHQTNRKIMNRFDELTKSMAQFSLPPRRAEEIWHASSRCGAGLFRVGEGGRGGQ